MMKCAGTLYPTKMVTIALYVLLSGIAARAQTVASSLSLPSGGTHTVGFNQPATTFYIEKPAIVDARSTDNRHITLVGLTPGTSGVAAYDAQGACIYRGQIHVSTAGVRRGEREQAGVIILQRGPERRILNCSGQHCAATVQTAP